MFSFLRKIDTRQQFAIRNVFASKIFCAESKLKFAISLLYFYVCKERGMIIFCCYLFRRSASRRGARFSSPCLHSVALKRYHSFAAARALRILIVPTWKLKNKEIPFRVHSNNRRTLRFNSCASSSIRTGRAWASRSQFTSLPVLPRFFLILVLCIFVCVYSADYLHTAAS